MSLDRKIIAIAAAPSGVYALADDGTLWAALTAGPAAWVQVPGLPPAPPCGSNVDRKGDEYVCELPEGHPHEHRRGAMVWR
jgi:hypothetical protein